MQARPHVFTHARNRITPPPPSCERWAWERWERRARGPSDLPPREAALDPDPRFPRIFFIFLKHGSVWGDAIESQSSAIHTRAQIMTERPGDGESFTRAHIGDCMARVVAVDLHQSVTVGAHRCFRCQRRWGSGTPVSGHELPLRSQKTSPAGDIVFVENGRKALESA